MSVSWLSHVPQRPCPLVTSAARQPQIKRTAKLRNSSSQENGIGPTIRDLRDPGIDACELKGLSTVRDELTAHPSGILLKGGGQNRIASSFTGPRYLYSARRPSGDESYKIVPEVQGLVSRNK